MTIFTKDQMWQAAVMQMGLISVGPTHAILLEYPEDVEELYEALKEAHEKCVAEYEWRML